MAKGFGYGIFLFFRNRLGWDVYDFFDLFVCLIAIGIVLSVVVFVAREIAFFFHPEWKPENNGEHTSDNSNSQANIASETEQSAEAKDIQQIYAETKAKIRKNHECALSKEVVNSDETDESSLNTKDIQKMYMETKAKTNKDVDTATRETPNARNFCSNCGAKIGQNERFCHSCGVELSPID